MAPKGGHGFGRSICRPNDEQEAVERHIQGYAVLTEAQAGVERDIAKAALADPNVIRLMTIPGIDMVVAVGLMAAIGQIERFDKPDQLARISHRTSGIGSVAA